jgi:hypothetical protein
VLLDEHRLDRNADGWLTLPWRNGWCASELAFMVAHRITNHATPGLEPSPFNLLRKIIRARAAHREVYYVLDEALLTIRWTDATPAMRASMRCVQVLVANSDGGGHVYNAILGPIAASITEEDIITWRCADAIGVHPSEPATPEIERRRRLFATAWRRGLFHLAYAIQPFPPLPF